MDTIPALTPPALRALEYAALLPPDHVPLFWLRRRFEREFPDAACSSSVGLAEAWSRIERELSDLTLIVPAEDEGGRLVRIHPHVQQRVCQQMSVAEMAARQQTLEVLVDARVAVLNQAATYRRQASQWELEPLGALAELWADRHQPRAAALLWQLGRWWSRLGVWSRAETFLRRALATAEAGDGAESPYVEISLFDLSLEVLRPTGRLAEAESLLRRIVRNRENSGKTGQRLIGVVLGLIAEIIQTTGRLAEAPGQLRPADEPRRDPGGRVRLQG